MQQPRVPYGLFLILLLVGAAAGWLLKPVPPQIDNRPPVPGPQVPYEKFEDWVYPDAEPFGSAISGPLTLAKFTTKHDLDRVAAWYSERLGRRLDPSENSIGGGGGAEISAASLADSVRPGVDTPPRAAKIGIGSRRTPGSIVTVIVNRLDGEDRTHIVLSIDTR